MGRIVVMNHVTLDGVMQDPGRPDEDADLIDEYPLMIHPLVLGSGRRMFPEGINARLRLTESVATPSGVVVATYEPLRD